MKIVTANLVPSRYKEEKDFWNSKGQYTGGEGDWVEYGVTVRGSRVRHSVMYVGPDGECRRDFGGPILPGPYAALIPQVSVIASHRLPIAEEVVELEDGDVIVCNGVPMAVWHNSYREALLLTLEELAGRDAEVATEVQRQVKLEAQPTWP